MPKTHAQQPQQIIQASNLWTAREAYLLAGITLMAGLAIGYLIRGSSAPAVAVNASAPVSAPVSQAPAPSAESIRVFADPLLQSLKIDPNHYETLVKLGNLYYDYKVFPEAITYYEKAVKVNAKDVNVLTDLGTSYWYAGFPEKAVVRYEQALAIQPTYAQTLFNLGVVRMDGLKDPRGAVAAWEKLLATNPQYVDRQKVQDLLVKARSQAG